MQITAMAGESSGESPKWSKTPLQQYEAKPSEATSNGLLLCLTFVSFSLAIYLAGGFQTV